jgi:monovalent cation/hydrogen antiporter
MRGVLALAAAISLPERLNNGAAFPGRNLIIFLTFCLIFVTLVLQGLSLPPLIRRLGLSGAGAPLEEEQMARREMITAALESLEKMREGADEGMSASYDQMEHFYRDRLALLEEQEEVSSQSTPRQRKRHDDVASELRNVERSVALRLRDENKINDEVLRDLERELDLLDARFVASGH